MWYVAMSTRVLPFEGYPRRTEMTEDLGHLQYSIRSSLSFHERGISADAFYISSYPRAYLSEG